MSTHDWTLRGAAGQPIYGSTDLPPDGVTPSGVIVICHGFKGYKDYGLLPALGHHAAMRFGLIAHRFNFSHSGMTPRDETFERPDLFEQDTWGKQIADLTIVARTVRSGELPGGEAAANLPMVWFGHSRGGVTVILTGARAFAEADAIRPVAVIAAAAPHRACNLDEPERRILRKQGYLESPSSRTQQVLRIGRAWLDEIEANPAAVDPLAAIGRLDCPVLLVHGEEDQTVPVAAVHALAAAGRPHAVVELIGDGGTHTFSAPNPMPIAGPWPPATARMIESVAGFAHTACIAAGAVQPPPATL